MGSLSPSSSDTQATGRPPVWIHSESSVDLPKPAGAEIRVRGPAVPASSRAVSRGRGTRLGRRAGM
ncbi:MAG: hypothetical protein DMF53_25270 [Acidobacteria bacterium]|nr:MAG: hypothetical protein DMF53_25270 [Acidobacteriota bacterium]